MTTDYTEETASSPARSERKLVDPFNYDPFNAKEFSNPGIIQWEQRVGLKSNIVRYIFWRIACGLRNGYHYDGTERQVAEVLGVPTKTVHTAVTRCKLFARTGSVKGQWRENDWAIRCPNGGNCVGKDCPSVSKCSLLNPPRASNEAGSGKINLASNEATPQPQMRLPPQPQMKVNLASNEGTITQNGSEGSNLKAPEGGGGEGTTTESKASPKKEASKTSKTSKTGSGESDLEAFQPILTMAYNLNVPFSEETLFKTFNMVRAYRKFAIDALADSNDRLWDWSSDDVLVHLSPIVEAASEAGVPIVPIYGTHIRSWVTTQIAQARAEGVKPRDFLRATCLALAMHRWVKEWHLNGDPYSGSEVDLQPDKQPDSPQEPRLAVNEASEASCQPVDIPYGQDGTKSQPEGEEKVKILDMPTKEPITNLDGTMPMGLF